MMQFDIARIPHSCRTTRLAANVAGTLAATFTSSTEGAAILSSPPPPPPARRAPPPHPSTRVSLAPPLARPHPLRFSHPPSSLFLITLAAAAVGVAAWKANAVWEDRQEAKELEDEPVEQVVNKWLQDRRVRRAELEKQRIRPATAASSSATSAAYPAAAEVSTSVLAAYIPRDTRPFLPCEPLTSSSLLSFLGSIHPSLARMERRTRWKMMQRGISYWTEWEVLQDMGKEETEETHSYLDEYNEKWDEDTLLLKKREAHAFQLLSLAKVLRELVIEVEDPLDPTFTSLLATLTPTLTPSNLSLVSLCRGEESKVIFSALHAFKSDRPQPGGWYSHPDLTNSEWERRKREAPKSVPAFTMPPPLSPAAASAYLRTEFGRVESYLFTRETEGATKGMEEAERWIEMHKAAGGSFSAPYNGGDLAAAVGSLHSSISSLGASGATRRVRSSQDSRGHWGCHFC
jgi:hypothetical protein